MKINLIIGGYSLNGYLNIDPIANPQDNQKVAHTLDNLDDLVDNNECSEILAYGILDVFPIEVKRERLLHLASKIEHGGVLVFSGTDIRKATKIISDENADLKNSNAMMYGNPAANPWLTKRGLLTSEEAKNLILSTNQFNVLSVEYVGLDYVVKAQRV